MVLCSTREPQNFIQKAQILAVLNNSVCASTLGRLGFDGSEAIETSVQTGLRLWFCLGTRLQRVWLAWGLAVVRVWCVFVCASVAD